MIHIFLAKISPNTLKGIEVILENSSEVFHNICSFLQTITTQIVTWITMYPFSLIVCLIVFALIIYGYIKAKVQNDEIQADYRCVNELYKESNSKIKSLESDKSQITRSLTHFKKRNAELQGKLTAETSKFKELSDKYENTQKENAELQGKLTTETSKCKELSDKCENIQKEIENERWNITQLEDELELETKKLKELQIKYDEKLRQLIPLRMQLGKVQKKLSTLTRNINSAKSENASLQQRIEDLESAVEEKDVLVIEREKTISELLANISEKESDLSEKNKTIADNESKINELEAKIASSISSNLSIEELEKERDLMIEQLESANSERDLRGKELQEQASLAETRGKEIERMTDELRKANDSINALNAEVIKLKTMLNASTENDSESIFEETEDEKPSLNSEPTKTTEEKPVEEIPESKEQGAKQETKALPKVETIQEHKTDTSSEELNLVASIIVPSTVDITKGQYVVKKHVHPIEEADEDVDLPVIENKTGYVKRSILQVIDVEQEDEELIDADEFFSRSPEEIANIARMLAEAAESGREAYICACCRTPVKISKRDFGSREVLFFSHCHGVVCDWKHEHSLISKPVNVFVEGEPYDGKARYREIKRLIVESLTSAKSREMGISDVEADKKIHSHHKFMYNRTACVYAKFKDKDLVIELQTKDVHMNTVVEKDMFYRLNDYNVIWVFGADEGGGYDFINKHVPKNIMYANKRNVFILDNQAIEACKKSMELVLKCNYLDPDGRWHYCKEKQGTNGILVKLNELSFDEDMCKAYYYDANEDYFNANPDVKKEYYDSIVSKEKLLKDLKDTWEGKVAERRKKLSRKNAVDMPKAVEPVISVDPVKKEEPKKKFTGYSDRYIYSFQGKIGVVDGMGNFIIPCEYNDIQVWTRGKYRVKKIDLWGVMDESRNIIVDVKYNEIGNLNNGKASVNTSTESYYIYENGTRVQDESIKLPNGWTKFRQGKQWGIADGKGNILVNCIYDEIGSFRGRLVGFFEGKFPAKLTLRYEYRMRIACRCVNNDGNRANYDINGVKLLESSKENAVPGNIYNDMVIRNMSFSKKVIFVSKLSPKKFTVKLEHIDQELDFKLGEIVRVTIKKIKGKKFYVRTDDGRKTYFTKSMLTHKGEYVQSYPTGTSLSIKKIDFDSEAERTIWEFVK